MRYGPRKPLTEMADKLEATYLPTDMGAISIVCVISGILTVVGAASSMFLGIIGNKLGAAFFGLCLTSVAALVMFSSGISGDSNAAKSNGTNLIQNIKKTYDVDKVQLVDDGHTTENGQRVQTATVYKDDIAFEVVIRQDEKTFEPTLISLESDDNDLVRELKK